MSTKVMPIIRVASLLTLQSLCFVPSARCQTDAPAIARFNKTSLEFLNDVYVSMTFTGASSFGSEVFQSELWRTDTQMRLHEHRPKGKVYDVLQRDGRQLLLATVAQGNNQVLIGLTKMTMSARTIEADPWRLGLLVLPTMRSSSPQPVVTLSEAVSKYQVRGMSATREHGRKLELVALRNNDSTGQTHDYEIAVDPAVNYLIRRVTHSIKGADGKIDFVCRHAVEEFVEIAPAVFFPKVAVSSYEYRGKPSVSHHAVFDKIVVNSPGARPKLPPLPIPAVGVSVTDELNGTTYWADRDGKPTSAPKVLRYVNAMPLPAPDPLLEYEAHTPWWKWTGGAVAVAGIAIVTWRLLRRSKSRESAE